MMPGVATFIFTLVLLGQAGAQSWDVLRNRVNQGTVAIISGGVNGTYIRIASDLAAVLDKADQLRVLPSVGKGSVQNIIDLLYLRGIDVGIVQSDVLSFSLKENLHPNIAQRIRYVTKLYNEEVHILVGKDIGQLSELIYKKVNVEDMVMTPDSLPTKPDRDAKFERARRDAPMKGEAAAPARENLPAKPAAESAPRQEGVAQPLSKDAHQPPSREPPDQERPRLAERIGEQYLRLRVRVENGQLSIVDSQLVDGPLAQTTAFQGRFAYEVTDGGRLLHAGSIPDLGTVRSFAHPNGTLEQQRHHSYELSSYEFDARVSVALLRGAELSKIAIALYRVKQPARPDVPPAMLSSDPLAVQREQQLREIGRVVGVPASVLPEELSSEAERPVSRRSTAKKTRSEDGDYDPDDERSQGRSRGE